MTSPGAFWRFAILIILIITRKVVGSWDTYY